MAVFRTHEGAVFALANYDPFAQASVLVTTYDVVVAEGMVLLGGPKEIG